MMVSVGSKSGERPFCFPMQRISLTQDEKIIMFLKVGHRGAKSYEIENTLESFLRAIDLGVNALELDVRKSKDGKLIISHDDNLKKVYDEDIHVGEASLEELKRVTKNRIATLDEALHAIDGKVDRILVELK
ncbi:MAG TPA: hypothetical protein DCP92_19620, partial [Nitrospiraceae bacterium]|nr:hypothetical protein [Nitrospiraceae bacterium]